MVHEIRNPNKHLHMFQIALGILAAFGLDGLMRAARSGERRLVRTVLWTSGAFAVTALAFWSAAGIVKGMTGVLQQRFVAGGWGQYAPVIVQNMWKALGHAGWMAAIGAVGVGAMAWGGFRFQVSGFRSQREEELATRERGEKRGFTPEATEGGRSRHKGTKGKRGIEQKNAKGAKGGDESLRGVLNCDGVQGGPTRVLQKRSPLAVFAIFCSISRRAGSGDGASPSQKNAKGAKGVRGRAKPQSAIGIRQSAIFLASSAMVLAVAIDAVWYSRDYIKTVKVNEIVGKNMVTEFLKENLHGQRALLLSQQGFYNQWLGTLFPYHDIPAFNVFQMPRMPKDYKHFLDVVGRNPLRMWELAAVGYALGPASFWGQIQEQPDWRAAFEPVAGFNVYPNGDGVGVAPATREQPAQHAVFRFKRGLDRYTLVRSWREAGDDVVCEELAESDFDPRAEVLVAPEDWGKVSGFRFQVSGGEGSGEETGPRMDTDGAEGAGESGDLNRSSRRTLRGGEGEETGPQMGADRGEAPSPNRQSATGNRQSITTVVETIRSMRMTTSADGPRILLVSQKWDKDFVAEVDGQPAPVLRCNYLCLGVPVPAGQHDVLIRYAPDTWHLWIQGAGMLIGLGAAVSLVVARIRRWGV